MRMPIAAGLAWPARMAAPTRRIDLVALSHLSFERPDEARFPALRLAREAMQAGAMAPCVLNAANEVAVEAFLTGRLGFLHIARLVGEVLEIAAGRGLLAEAEDLEAVLAVDAAARRLAESALERRMLA
jgi:1-deoxy-D-xylulose-5-phosphate reductoisomerase